MVLRLHNGTTRTFHVVRATRYVNRLVIVAKDETREFAPENILLRGSARDDDEIMLIQPDSVAIPFVITAFEPLPGGQVACIATDQIPSVFTPATVTFIGEVLDVIGNLAVFQLPDGATRALRISGRAPAIGSQVVVVEDGRRIISYVPAFVNFIGQVVDVNQHLVTFELPNGDTRTLRVASATLAPGNRVVVFERGERVSWLQVLRTY